MKYFATGFFLKEGATTKAVINECLSWVSNSPHTAFIPAQIDLSRDKEYFDIEGGNERVELISFYENNVFMSCFRYSKISMPHKWITEVSINEYFEDGSLWVQIQSSVVTQEVAYRAPNTKKPLIVMHLLDKFSGGNDDIFNVDLEPVLLIDDEENINLASGVINASTKNRLPVVYISSKYFYREHAHNLIPGRLARKLSGLAHVVVEPEGRVFSNKLKYRVKGRNVYGGAVGIYWPNGQGVSVHRREGLSASDFENEIFNEILRAITSLVPLKKGGWVEITNAKIRKSIQDLKEKGSSSAELMALYEDENSLLQEEVRDLSSRISTYEARIRTLLEKTPVQGDLSLRLGDEDDFFQGEILEFIMFILNKSLSTMHEGSRCHDVISAIVSHNTYENKIDEMSRVLKQALVGYKSMTPKISSALKQIGFEASQEGKHWKITYHGDPRYTYILPKTGSDHRGSLNAYSDISNKVFL